MGKKLLEMHENPEKTGFGTVGLADVISENSRCIKALTHYIKWSVQEQTGKVPPPYLEEPS